MKFEELDLVLAIDAIGGGKEYTTDVERFEFATRVQRQFCEMSGDTFFPYRIDDVHRAYMKWRKNSDTKIKAAIAAAHGTRCFWVGRGKGPCSDEAEAGHLWQDHEGGPLSVENCIIECKRHNAERGPKSIEEYLRGWPHA